MDRPRYALPSADGRSGVLNLSPAEARTFKKRLTGIRDRHFRGSQRVHQLLNESVEAYLEGPSVIHKMMIASNLVRCMVEVFACYERRRTALPPGDLSGLLVHLEAHLDDNPQVPDLALLAGLSTSRFKAKFKEEVGIPPADYLMGRKIEKAKRLLKEKSVTQAGLDMGFSTSQYFATVFKRYTGLTPTAFRQGAVL